jgi:hypothetical protein
MTTLVKRASEVRTYVMDMSALPELAGSDTVSSITSITCTEALGGSTNDLTITSKTTSSSPKGASCKIAGGVDGARYTITHVVVTAASLTLVGIGYLFIDEG